MNFDIAKNIRDFWENLSEHYFFKGELHFNNIFLFCLNWP